MGIDRDTILSPFDTHIDPNETLFDNLLKKTSQFADKISEDLSNFLMEIFDWNLFVGIKLETYADYCIQKDAIGAVLYFIPANTCSL